MAFANSSVAQSQGNIVISKTNNEKIISELSVGNSKLKYRLIKNTRSIDGQVNDVYGIEVESSLFDNLEIARVEDVTTKLEFAQELLETIADNAVLPTSLKEIIEDFIVEKYS